ncbi:MAG: DUF4328 domain-containing protein [Planctomycetes bacterium]|nr:DUF4328 domain-containing protein [Planctomycetota bacterium]
MPNTISCPHCQRLLQLPEGYHGGDIRCPECGRIFVGGSRTEITAQAPPPLPPAATDVRAIPDSEPWAARRPSRGRVDDYDDVPSRAAYRRHFKPAGGLGVAVKVMLTLSLVMSLLLLGSDWLQYQLAIRLIAGARVEDAEIDGNDDRQMVLGLAHFLFSIATVVVFSMWFYRAHANLKPLGAERLNYSSGWAVGYWFVPILNLFRPVQVAQEIWRNSDPNAVMEEDIRIVTPRNSTLIGFWWAAWIIMNVISNISVQATFAVNSPETLRAATIAGMVAEVATIIAAIFALAVVVAIDARQRDRAEAVHSRADMSL